MNYMTEKQLVNMDEACGRDNEGRPRYNVSLSAVSPAQAGQKNLESAFCCCGIEGGACENPEVQVEALHSYGVHAHLWQSDGNNAHKLLKEARGQAQCAEGLFGFYMLKVVYSARCMVFPDSAPRLEGSSSLLPLVLTSEGLSAYCPLL